MLCQLLSQGSVILSPWILIAVMTSAALADDGQWQPVISTIDPRQDSVAGHWMIEDGELKALPASGARLMLPVAPRGQYDIRVRFTRTQGVHSIGVVIVQGGKQVVFEVDAWAMHLAGFQNLDGRSIRDNATRREDIALTNGQEYSLNVEVRKDRLRGLLDGKLIAEHRTDGSDLSVPDLWALPDKNRLAVVAWDSAATFHAIDIRSVGESVVSVARPASTSSPASTPNRSMPLVSPSPTQSSPREAMLGNNAQRHVLMVIANYHFFYREYSEPRAELERAGIKVTVAAGRKAPCRPHQGSGEGDDGGIVQPDLALGDVIADDYDAILFSGGWGSSAYQYAFQGRYDQMEYNGDRETKDTVNRLINNFLKQKKQVAALCNAVSVLAWARVDGKSPLAGKLVCAPTRQAPTGIYAGRRAQPSCRWHPEINGARLSPPGSIGAPGTPVDDVQIDGLIITGEDDPSAREMGRRLAQILTR